MTFDWKEYLGISEFLTKGCGIYSTEAAYRCATSKAYFAAYCLARNFARDFLHFNPATSHSDHGRVREHYRAIGERAFAEKLDRLRQWRNTCDYDDEIESLESLSTIAIKEAHNICEKLSNWQNSSRNNR